MTLHRSGKMTLGQLAKASGLARSSLIHYETLGLLLPAARTDAGYRLYGEAQRERLHLIRSYRDAGLSLPDIGQLLTTGVAGEPTTSATPAALLETRLVELNKEVTRLRTQQKMLARLLATPEMRHGMAGQGKAAWVALLKAAGFDDTDMHQWHISFEADSPDRHAAFLASLGLTPDEIASIRTWSSQQG